MKKIALVMSLFLGATTLSLAQKAEKEVPDFAKPRNEAEKPVIARAQAETAEMVKMFKLDDKKELTLLEINVGIERRIADAQNQDNKDALLAEVEAKRWNFYQRYLTPEQYAKYKEFKQK